MSPPRSFQQSPMGNLFGRPPPATLWLMVATGVLSVATLFSAGEFGDSGSIARQLVFSPSQVLDAWKIWTAFTYLFVGYEPFWLIAHIVFMLWILGAQLERQWGTRRYLFYFFGTGTGAAIVTTLLALAFPALRFGGFGQFQGTYVAGEALLLGWVLMNWHSQLYFFFIPVRAPAMLAISIAIPVLYTLMGAWRPFIPVFLAMGIGFLMLNRRFSLRRSWLHFRAWRIDKQLKRRARKLRVVPPPDEEREEPKHYLH